MHIGFFTDSYLPTRSGVVTSQVQLKEALERRGHRVTVFTIASPGAVADAAVHRSRSVPLDRRVEARIGLTGARRLRAVVEQAGLDVVHTHTEFTLGLAGKRLARDLGLPLVHTAHTIYEPYRHYLPAGRLIPRSAVGRYLATFLEGFNLITCPSRKMAGYLGTVTPGAPTRVIGNGVDPTRFHAASADARARLRRRFGWDDGEAVAVYAGRLASEKRVRELIAGLAPLLRSSPTVRLMMAGAGPQSDRLRRETRRAGVAGAVTFLGAIPWVEMPALYAAADVFVTASLSEVQPMTALEAVSCGLPVVARRDRAFDGIVIDGRSGLLAGDDAGLSRALRAILDDPVLSAGLAAGAHRAAATHTIDERATQWERIYADLVSRRSVAELPRGEADGPAPSPASAAASGRPA